MGQFWSNKGYLLNDMRPFWCHIGPFCSHMVLFLSHMGHFWGHIGQFWSHMGHFVVKSYHVGQSYGTIFISNVIILD